MIAPQHLYEKMAKTPDNDFCASERTVSDLPRSPTPAVVFKRRFDRSPPILHTADKMFRRLGILLLLVAVTFSATATCPRQVAACSMVRQAAHDCCNQRTMLRSNDCCCNASHQLTSQAINTVPQDKHASVALVAAVSHLLPCPLHTTESISTSAPLADGADPPDTLVTQHTQLLL